MKSDKKEKKWEHLETYIVPSIIKIIEDDMKNEKLLSDMKQRTRSKTI